MIKHQTLRVECERKAHGDIGGLLNATAVGSGDRGLRLSGSDPIAVQNSAATVSLIAAEMMWRNDAEWRSKLLGNTGVFTALQR